MNNALGQPQNVVLLGGTSDIGLAIVRRLQSPVLDTVVLACRDIDAGQRAATALDLDGVDVRVVPFEATATAEHQHQLDALAAELGDLDVVIVAFALLGDDSVTTTDAAAAAELGAVNFTGVVSATVATANVLRRQGHGSIVVLSSVAGERVRAANPVYGGTKAGVDGFAQGLGDRLAADGVHVLVVRPGFVHTKMTDGRPPAPLSTTPEHVAEVTVAALRRGRRMVWAPTTLRYVFSVLRHVPAPIWRRLPLG
jgi:decaprenylphospho-beta-D-erythro-pentofuranosid-2-ulose 2-reductase